MKPQTSSPDDLPGDLAGLKACLAGSRRDLEAAHRQGRSPRGIMSGLADLCDRTVEQTFRLAIAEAPEAGRTAIVKDLALVAVGGYGRRDLAPHSDVDLLFLTNDRDRETIRPFVSRMVRDLWDVGLYLSHSVRSITDCLGAARADLTACTALAEARLVFGSSARFAELQRKTHTMFRAMPLNRFLADIQVERGKEHQDYQARTVLLLEPNLKKSPGGLRDYHMLRWVALARHGIQDPEMLQAGRLLADADAEALARGRDFLYLLRNEMHFHAGSAQDVLTREEQVRLAEWLKFRDEGGMLGVERFMQEYYRRTTALNDVVQRFLEGSHRPGRLRRIVQRVSTSRVEQHFLLRPPTISIAPDSAATVLDSAERMVLLFDCARDYDVAVEHESAEMVRRAAGHAEVTPAARMRFHRLLANPVGLGRLVRNLNRAGLLGRLLPPFERARCLIQFNLQHRYTVDEHSLRALEAALRRLDDDGPLGGAYRAVGNKALLHLAILLHDLGKGMDGDHCEIGRDIAEGVAREFGLADHERHVLCFLVRQHLLMAHTAFRRDLGDDTTLVQFAREVATPEMLRMLYVLTAADTEAVSPESWTAWKQSLLDQLYARTAEELTGQSPVGNEEERAAAIRSSLAIVLGPHFPADWLVRQLELMPLGYLQSVPAPRIRRDLQVLEQSGSDLVAHVASEWLPEAGFVEYTVFTRDDLTEGIFSKIAGTLSSSGFQIVDARITTRSDDLVIDTFRGQDLTFTGEPPVSHRQEVGRQICDVLLGCKDVEKLLSRRRMPLGTRAAGMIDIPPRVEIDNDTSTRCTIVEVFAEDRLGRLYTITRTLFDLGLSVQSARISTHADQIVDAFYVTTRTGAKITDTGKLETLRARLLEVLARK